MRLSRKDMQNLVTCVDDILVELEAKLKSFLKKDVTGKEEKAMDDLTDIEKNIYVSIDYEPCSY